uniref:Rapid alkalinization factor 1 n=3 Tax=Setaria TaxID=4554 RepID=K3XSQ8_SETIT
MAVCLREQSAPNLHTKQKQSNLFPLPLSHLRSPAAAAMAGSTRALLIPLLLLLALAALARAGEVPAASALGWELGVVGAAEDEEFGFPDGDSVARRVLQNQNNGYISYGALRRDNVPCSVRGASYYNCRPGAQANPYSRGCNAITRCRG